MDTDECREELVKIYDELGSDDTKRAKTYMKSMGVPEKKLQKSGDDSDDLAQLTLSHFKTVPECKAALRSILEKIPKHDLVGKFQNFFETEPPSNIKAQTDRPSPSNVIVKGADDSQSSVSQDETVDASPGGCAPNSEDKDKEEDKVENRGSVLLLNDEWGTSKGGISTVNRQVAQQAKLAGFRVYATALTAGGEDEDDAKEKGVELIKADAAGSESAPDKKWLNLYHSRHFPSIKEIPNLKAIIGHVPITSPAAIDIKENCFSGSNVKVFLFNHVLPQYTEKHKESWDISLTEIKTDEIVEQAGKVDGIFQLAQEYSNVLKMSTKYLIK
ncbi:uncharacterized protein [Ptychodera flava]|uniref:uncharacterized protein n=1 Tax=Ptychodera flava TaxID=63121 RepID=UPI00396A6FDF